MQDKIARFGNCLGIYCIRYYNMHFELLAIAIHRENLGFYNKHHLRDNFFILLFVYTYINTLYHIKNKQQKIKNKINISF